MDGVENRGIVLLFDEETNKRAIDLSAACGNMLGMPTKFSLGADCNLPHMSMIHLPIADVRIASIHGWLTGFAGTNVAKRARSGSFSSVRLQKGYCLWLTPLTSELRALHEEIITEMARHRAEHPPYRETYTEAEGEMWIRYGASNVGRNFEPHLTLVPQMGEGNVWQEEIFQKYTVTHIAIADIGPRGTVSKVHVKISI